MALLDVFRILPLPVVRTNVWVELAPHDKASWKQVSRGALDLACLLTTSAKLKYVGSDQREGEVSDAISTTLARLPDVTCLSIDTRTSATSDAVFQSLAQAGTSACSGNVTALHVQAIMVTADTFAALRLALPSVSELSLTVDASLRGSVFNISNPRWSAGVTSLDVSVAQCSADSLRSIAGLRDLRHLKVEAEEVEGGWSLASWIRLHDLRCLQLDLGADMTLVDATPIRTLTRLTRLTMQLVASHRDGQGGQGGPGGPGGQGGQGGPGGQGGQGGQRRLVGAACRMLQGLTSLEELHLGRRYVAGEAELAALQHLTRVTALGLARISREPALGGIPAPRRLVPLLARLSLSKLFPSQLHASLSLLLPLDALHHIGGPPHDGVSSLHVVAVGHCLDNGHAEGQALLQASHCLANCPRVEALDLTLNMYVEGDGTVALTAAQLVQGLQPVRARVRCLSWLSATFGSGGAALGWHTLAVAVLHQLRHLTLESCDIGAGVWLSEMIGDGVQTLSVQHCRGLSERHWVDLSCSAARPLDVYVVPALSPVLVLWCQTDALRARGVASVIFRG